MKELTGKRKEHFDLTLRTSDSEKRWFNVFAKSIDQCRPAQSAQADPDRIVFELGKFSICQNSKEIIMLYRRAVFETKSIDIMGPA